MADDRKKRGGADRTRVNLQEPYEVDYWCKQFRCTVGELKEAVDAVGVLAKNVRIYIASHKQPLQTSNGVFGNCDLRAR